MRIAVFIGFLVVGYIATAAAALPEFPAPVKGDRIVVVAPHPDDESLGAGGFIQQAVAVGAAVRIVYLTNGDHNQIAFKLYSHSFHLGARDYFEFGERRRREAINAAHLLGLTDDHLVFLGYPDAGTFAIWNDYWEEGDVFASDATRTNAVPYPEATTYQHLYKPQNIAADLLKLLEEFKPNHIIVTHPADTNPDHRAAANFVRLAALQLADEGFHPHLHYYVIHFGNWPRPLHFHPDAELKPPAALLDDGPWKTFALTPKQTEMKHLAILQHRTQITTRQYYLESFARANEIFSDLTPESVPCLPADERPDWARAVRAKMLTVSPAESTRRQEDPLAKLIPTAVIPLETIDFLRQNGELVAIIGLSNWLGKRTGVHLDLYPYQRGIAFAKMPKVEIRISPLGALHVLVGEAKALDHGVTFNTVDNRIIARIPMKILGGTKVDHIFASARAHFGEIAPDDSAWQLLELTKCDSE